MISANTLLRTRVEPVQNQTVAGKKAGEPTVPKIPDQGIPGPVLYVATDLRSWVAFEPKNFARDVGLNGTCYRRLDPNYYAWLRHMMNKAKLAFESKTLDKEAFEELRGRFNEVHAWAMDLFGIEALQTAWRSFLPLKAMYKPPTMALLEALGFEGKPEDEEDREPPSPWYLFPEGDFPFHCQVTREAVQIVREIADEAKALGWTEHQLFQNRSRFKFPHGKEYGLVCFVKPGQSIRRVFKDRIEIDLGKPWKRTAVYRR